MIVSQGDSLLSCVLVCTPLSWEGEGEGESWFNTTDSCSSYWVLIDFLEKNTPTFGLDTKSISREFKWMFKKQFSPVSLGNGSTEHLVGFRTGLSKMCHFGMWIILSWKQSRPCRTRNLYLSLKEFKLGDLPIIRVITRNRFLWPVYKVWETSE